MAMTSLTRWATEAAASLPSTVIVFLVAIFANFSKEVGIAPDPSVHDVGQPCLRRLRPERARRAQAFRPSVRLGDFLACRKAVWLSCLFKGTERRLHRDWHADASAGPSRPSGP